MGRNFVENFLNQSGAQAITLDEDLFLIAEVMVQGWFGDIQAIGDIVHRCPAIALFQKELCGGFQHCFTLGGGIPPPAGEGVEMSERMSSVFGHDEVATTC
jgi:hypothetical protein